MHEQCPGPQHQEYLERARAVIDEVSKPILDELVESLGSVAEGAKHLLASGNQRNSVYEYTDLSQEEYMKHVKKMRENYENH